MNKSAKLKIMTGTKRIMAFLLVLLMVIGTVPVLSKADEIETIRVAVFPLGSFQYFDENGDAQGYNIDYLNRIAENTHWNYEYVEATNFQDACRLLDEDKVDIVAPVQYKDYLAEKYEYSAYTMAIESGAVFVLNTEKNENLLYEDFGAMNDMKFGMVNYEGSSFTSEFIDNYSVKNNVNPKSITYYNNMTEVFSALNNGEVDAVVSNILFNCDDYKMISRFSSLSSYYIMQKDEKELKEELDINNSMKAGMNDHISKPIDTELMYQVLDRWINRDCEE